MRLCPDVDLRRSLATVFANRRGAAAQIERDADRQGQTAEEIVRRFFTGEADRREIVLLADEVGLGKTFVALTVAVSLLDAIRRAEAPDDLPQHKPVVLVLTPNSTALYNKWRREAQTFQRECGRGPDALSWFTVTSPLDDEDKAGNVIDLAEVVRTATRSRPVLVIAKLSMLGSALHANKDWWRRRALAVVFQRLGVSAENRPRLCRYALGSGSQAHVPELLDLRQAGKLWDDTAGWSSDLKVSYELALEGGDIKDRLQQAIVDDDEHRWCARLDDLTRLALMRSLRFPLVIIDEIHNLKNEATAARQNVEMLLDRKVSRLLGLSATPFQLEHGELLRVLGLRRLLALPTDRRAALDEAVADLASVMDSSRQTGERLRDAWRGLRAEDAATVQAGWEMVEAAPRADWRQRADQARPSRVARALRQAVEVETANRRLESRLRPFVIRHRHDRCYRRHFVGGEAARREARGSPFFDWAAGMEVQEDTELAHYLLMRAVALAKEEKGRAGLGAELTGSYRHLIETSATWKRLGGARDPRLATYQQVLAPLIQGRDADQRHPKIDATVERALRAFEAGHKTVVFCVYIKTAEAVRDELDRRLSEALAKRRDLVFGDEVRFLTFRQRFFNRREPLFALIQDHPLLGRLADGTMGIPPDLRLDESALLEVGALLEMEGDFPDVEKPDRRLLLAAVEHVAINTWQGSGPGREWLSRVFQASPELGDSMARRAWVPGRPQLAAAPRETKDPEAGRLAADPLSVENADEPPAGRRTRMRTGPAGWAARLRASADRRESVAHVIAPYFREDVLGITGPVLLPLLAQHHAEVLAALDVGSRRSAGQTFRRILMAPEYLIRYLADAPREHEELWAEYLAKHYTERLVGQHESLKERVHAYLETLVRARSNQRLLDGYREAAGNLNIIQLVKGGMPADRYFLGFNTPYRPEILITTSVGQEGIDLHRECRHVIHHDLCWNPAVIEQRTGRVDRIGSKVERERAEAADSAPSLEIAVPYLAATYDERMFEELYRRAQLFEVTMGGDFRVEGRVEAKTHDARARDRLGIGTLDEDLGSEGNSGTVDLPPRMVERLRVGLAVWRGERARAT